MNRRFLSILGAYVLVAGGSLAGFGIMLFRSMDDLVDQPVTGPTIVVEASYPGANAKTVDDCVAGPIEGQVNGVEDAVRLASRSSDDGRYVLTVTFRPGADLDMALTLVQVRVQLALQALPPAVQRTGVTVKKKTLAPMIVTLSSPDGRHDALYLSNYAKIKLVDELARVPGVGDVVCIGTRRYDTKIQLDPLKLKAFGLRADEVIDALRLQNVEIAAMQVGNPNEAHIIANGRLLAPADIDEIVVKVKANGQRLFVRDVARVELVSATDDGDARANGHPAVALAIYPLAKHDPNIGQALPARLEFLRSNLPDGLKLDVSLDLSPNVDEYFLLDFDLPDDPRHADDVVTRAEKLLSETKDVQNVLSLSKNPFDGMRHRPYVLVRAPANQRAAVAERIRPKLAEIPNATVRLYDMSRPGRPRGHLDVAVVGPEVDRAVDLAKAVAARPQASDALTDVAVDRQSMSRPEVRVDVDREKAKALGIKASEVANTLQVNFGNAVDAKQFAQTGRLVVSCPNGIVHRAEDLSLLHIRNDKGEEVPLRLLAQIQKVGDPRVIHRIDELPAVYLSANVAKEASLIAARAEIEARFGEARQGLNLGPEYRLTWR